MGTNARFVLKNGTRFTCRSTERVAFLQSSKGCDVLPFESNNKPNISSILWGDKYWMEKIFDRAAGGLKRTHLDALFLSLEAARVLCAEKRKGGTMQWNIHWSEDGTA